MSQCIVIVQFDLPKRTREQAIAGGQATWLEQGRQAESFGGRLLGGEIGLQLGPRGLGAALLFLFDQTAELGAAERCFNQAHAKRQRRLTVRSDSPRAPAVSSTVQPP